MRNFLKNLNRSGGFTLVELMVVVAIIGLLSAVAIPNFKKYQAKAKISEAKLQLSAVYTAEQSFFADYNMYHNCLVYMGFDPGPEYFNRYYAVGFVTATTINATAYSAAQNSGLNTAECVVGATVLSGSSTGGNSAAAATVFPGGKGIGGAIATTAYVTATGLGDQSTSANMTFTAGAGGIISQDYTGTATASYLTIDNKKVFRNIRNGY